MLASNRLMGLTAIVWRDGKVRDGPPIESPYAFGVRTLALLSIVGSLWVISPHPPWASVVDNLAVHKDAFY